MESKSLRNIITIIICLSLATTGIVYQYVHNKNVSRNKEMNQAEELNEQSQEIESTLNNESTAEVIQTEENSNSFSNNEELEEEKEVAFPISELGDVDNETVSETADGYYSNELVSIDNLEVLTSQIEDINTYQVKYQIKSYLNLSGYDIYEVGINEESIREDELTCHFSVDLSDSEELAVIYEKDTKDFVFEIIKK